jgi:hypothetical protein
MTENKLAGIERTINVYDNNNEPLEEINIDYLSLDVLKSIVPPKEDDPFLYDGYVLDADQLKKINEYLNQKIVPNFDIFFYVLECAGIYDWKKD